MLEYLIYKIEEKDNFVYMDRLYCQSGLWVQSHGCRLRVGLTDRLANVLGAVSSISLPQVGSNSRVGDKSVKVIAQSKTTEIEIPLAGRIRAVNLRLEQQPELLIQDPFGEGWLFEVDPFNWEDDKNTLLSPMEFYELQTEKEA